MHTVAFGFRGLPVCAARAAGPLFPTIVVICSRGIYVAPALLFSLVGRQLVLPRPSFNPMRLLISLGRASQTAVFLCERDDRGYADAVRP